MGVVHLARTFDRTACGKAYRTKSPMTRAVAYVARRWRPIRRVTHRLERTREDATRSTLGSLRCVVPGAEDKVTCKLCLRSIAAA